MTDADANATPIPLIDADKASATDWHGRFRARLVCLGITLDHSAYPELIEIGEPWPAPRHDSDFRWAVWRDTRGLGWCDNHTSEVGRAATMDEALATVWDIIEDERQAAMDAIPLTLLPPLPAMFGSSD
jgi:hypothetical protein